MATAGSGHTGIYNSRSGLPTFGNFGNTLLERSNPGLRRSTPDSEALASSDEEVEHTRLRSIAQNKTNPIRRSSVLADQSHDSRRLSFAANSAHSPGPGSQPNTPGSSHENWSTISPSVGAWNGASAYPFGTNIWGSSSRDPPARLQEVRNDSESRLPFVTSSQPNTAVQRSMSFSVGQSEYNMAPSATDNISHSGAPGLTRRTSRPSNLGQEYSGLSRVSESEGAGFFSTTSSQTAHIKTQSRALSNASTHTTSSSALHNTPSILRTTSSASAFRNPRFTSSLLEASEVAIDDADDTMAQSRYPIRNAPSRRLSDFQAIPTRQPNAPPYSSAAFGSTRNTPHWSSNLDFGQLDTIPQSRRHSFADIPTRRGSMDTHEEDEQSYEDGSQGGVQIGHEALLTSAFIASYFNSNAVTRRVTEQEVQRQIQHEHHQAIFSPGPYGIPTNSASSIGSFHGPTSAPLFIVNFKCSRSDIFYIQEGTGLSVKDNDLVIVEADRGTDMGVVQHSNVTLDAARKYKAFYAEAHFASLMMWSQQTRAGAGNLFNPNAVVPGGKSGGAGASQQGTAIRESDLKPKMIKRLAQTHEIQALQEKEGNEAKAKRVCQQKVIEHGLNMEILDAEFQMDGKKLTFYFFSTEYINFNSLVTDLFKMYKTRIWMSAINPASFQSPVSSLGITPIYGNTGLGLSQAGLGAAAQPSTNIYDDSREDPRYTMSGMPMNMNPHMSMTPHMPMSMPMSLSMAQAQHQARSAMQPPLYYGGYGQTPTLPEYAHNPATYSHGPHTYQHPSQNTNDPFSGSGYGGGSSGNLSRAINRPNSGSGGSGGGGTRNPNNNNHTSHPNNTNPNSFANAFGSLSLRG